MDDSVGSSVELSSAQCRELLAAQSVGRVAFVTARGPRIVPLNYTFREESVEFRTSPYSEMALNAPGTVVAFEVDELDPTTRSGWSVVVTGECRHVLDDEDPTAGLPEGSRTTPWAGGHRPLVLRIHPSDLSGRRVGHAESQDPGAHG